MSISRRVFVKSGGLALVSFGLDPLFLARAAFTSYEPMPPHAACCRPVLVCLFQRGAVDGLNMIVPHGDPIYYQERPRIAVPEKDVLDLDGSFGLHPGLAALKPLWDAKTLAAILAIDDLQAFGLPAPQPAARDRLTRAFEELYAGSATGLLSTSSREAFDAVQMLKRLDPGQYRPANGADYPRGRLGKALLEIAQL